MADEVRKASRRRRVVLVVCFLSGLLNGVLCLILFMGTSTNEEPVLAERTLYGSKKANNKIAIVHAEGALVEGLDNYILKQIEQAGRDEQVQGVVLRVDSPGGTIGSSEAIHRELLRLTSGKHPRHPDFKAKKLVTSMGSIAASGGYYIAMPSERILAEKGCLTGSIGVYASLPNVSGLADKHGVKMELIKAGGIKASGSPFHEMTPQERQPWQDMVDQAYEQFLDVVVAGRPKLAKNQLRSEIVSRKMATLRDNKGNPLKDDQGKPKTTEVTRYRADGGTYTADEALLHGLIDEIGLVEDAVTYVAQMAGIAEYRVVRYDRPTSFLTSLLGVHAEGGLQGDKLAAGFAPRLWYLTPHAEVSGIIAIATQRN